MKPFFDFQMHAECLLDSINDQAKLERAYADYVEAVLNSPLWSPKDAEGIRIPWRSASQAFKAPGLCEVFKCCELYWFGSSQGVPLYLGKSGTLQKRLNVYISNRRGLPSACMLAVEYEKELIAHGVDGVPKEFWDAYRQRFPRNKKPLTFFRAVAFARHGIEGIWFTPLPIPDPQSTRALETRLIPIANEWNRLHDYQLLDNERDV